MRIDAYFMVISELRTIIGATRPSAKPPAVRHHVAHRAQMTVVHLQDIYMYTEIMTMIQVT